MLPVLKASDGSLEKVMPPTVSARTSSATWLATDSVPNSATTPRSKRRPFSSPKRK